MPRAAAALASTVGDSRLEPSSAECTDGDDTIWAGTGDDILSGREGDDEHWLGAGNDRTFGFIGNDTLYGSPSVDLPSAGA